MLSAAVGTGIPQSWHFTRTRTSEGHGVPGPLAFPLATCRACSPPASCFFIRAAPRQGQQPKASSAPGDRNTADPSLVELKQKLEESLQRTDTNLNEESLGIVAELESRNPTPQPALREDLWAGPFQMLNSSMNNLLYRGCQVTLGRATFNAFKPNSLLLTMEEVYNDVHVHGSDAYNVLIPFTIAEPGVPQLKGVLFNEARISPSSDTRLNVEFLGSTLMPRDDTVDLGTWLEVFGKVNDMDERGVCRVVLPPAKGWLDVTYLDDNYRITRGNFGTLVIVKRLKTPAITVYALPME